MEETQQPECTITEDSCCWCYPGTVANSICATHEAELLAGRAEQQEVA